MKIADYLIDTEGLELQSLLKPWSWLVSGTWTLWFMNRFGDLFMYQDGPVYRLSLDDGSFSALANSKKDFGVQLDQGNNANDWLLIPLVDDLVVAGKVLDEGECYGFVQLPILGGDYTVENVAVRKIKFQYAALGQIFEKLENLPDGTRVSFEITE